MRIKINVRGIQKVRNRLGTRAANDLEDALELDLMMETRKQASDAYKTSPVETGALRTSLLQSPRRAGKMTFYWGTRLPYGLRQEYEHKPKRGWMRKAWRVGNRRTGKTIRLTIRRKLKGG